MVPHTFSSVDDLLRSQPLSIDVEIDDPCCGSFVLKGVELEGVVLYVVIPGFSRLALELAPPELLIFRNMFASWMRASLGRQAFHGVEKILDNGSVLVFSPAFGSADPFLDALRAARLLGENDEPGFRPAIGIASGTVLAGFAGSPEASSASLYGHPIVAAAGCALMKPPGECAASITFPERDWQGRSFEEAFSPLEFQHPEAGRVRQPQAWRLGDVRHIGLSGMAGSLAVRDVASFVHWMTELSAVQQSREWFRRACSEGYYRKRR